MPWYALKIFYNRSEQIADELRQELAVETYLPTVVKVVERNGQRKKTVCPLVSSLLFFLADPELLPAVKRLIDSRAMIYTRPTESGREPAPIPDREMQIFRMVASSGAEGLEYIPDGEVALKKGETVRVIAGPLRGAEGHIVRIRGDRRLLVEIQGVCAIATSYIPRAMLQPVNE